jgi:DNA-binding CsgD family transcriptional regulator
LISPFTKTQVKLFPEFEKGLSSQELAIKLGISVKTVEVHLKHIFDKLYVTNGYQAIARETALQKEGFSATSRPIRLFAEDDFIIE